MMKRDVIAYIKHLLDVIEVQDEMKDEQPGHGFDRFKTFEPGETITLRASNEDYTLKVELSRGQTNTLKGVPEIN